METIPMWRNSSVATELINLAEEARYGRWYTTIQVDKDEQTLSIDCEINEDERGQRSIEVLQGELWSDAYSMRKLNIKEICEIEKLIN